MGVGWTQNSEPLHLSAHDEQRGLRLLGVLVEDQYFIPPLRAVTDVGMLPLIVVLTLESLCHSSGNAFLVLLEPVLGYFFWGGGEGGLNVGMMLAFLPVSGWWSA